MMPPKKNAVIKPESFKPEPEMEEPKPKIDITKLRRKKTEPEIEGLAEEHPPVAWEIRAKAIDLAFNPTDEALPSFTVIDKFQGRLFPLIDLINVMWDDILQVAHYRQDKDEYKRLFKQTRPKSANWLQSLLISTARWQKSIGGTNLTKITDIALAETESRVEEEGGVGGGVDAWGKE